MSFNEIEFKVHQQASKKIYLYYTRFKEELPINTFQEYLNSLPEELKDKNERLLRWQDKQANLFGKLLLIEGLKKYNCSEGSLEQLKYDKYSRPYLKNNEVEFNISHSGEFVICAIGNEIKLGIDVEEVKDIEFKHFQNVMSNEQWLDIYRSKDPIKTFFKYWTMKESVIKADGRGLNIPLQNLHLEGSCIKHDDQEWHLKRLRLDDNYCAYLATEQVHVDIEMIKIDFVGNSKS